MAIIANASPADDSPDPLRCDAADKIQGVLRMLALGPVVELRAPRVSRAGTDVTHVETAIYPTDGEGLRKLARDARALSPRAEAVFVTLNDLRPDLKGAATDADVTRRVWLLVDVDPVRPAGVSSTDAEKQAAWQVALSIRDGLEGRGWPRPILADSGNGFHLLYRVDLPADDGGLVARVLAALGAEFDTDLAKVDRTIGNSSRICKLYGTLARKGRSTAERPHRAAFVLEAFHPMEVVPTALLEGLAGPAEGTAATKAPRPAPSAGGIVARDLGEDPVEAYATKALEEEVRLVSTTPNGHRNHQLFKSSAALRELVNAGTLDGPTVEWRLRDAARIAGLADAEIETTLGSARRKTQGKSRSLEHVGRPATRTVVDPADDQVRKGEEDWELLAEGYMRERRRHGENSTILFWNDEWHTWDAGAWSRTSPRVVSAGVTKHCLAHFRRRAKATGATMRNVGTRTVGNVMTILGAKALVDPRDVLEQPAWLGVAGPPPAECLNCRNGILHLPTAIEKGPEAALTPPTPRFFAANVLDYDFDPEAPRPERWLSFLKEVWPDDPESILCLQQWFGYLLTPDTSQQKILLMLGPSRAGKGTIVHVLRRLLGRENTTAPTLSKLGGQFGCQALIGKLAAFCGESRMSGRSDSQAIVERLLSISGEDPQSIERKNLVDWEGRITARFVMSANELPRLGDYSNAMPNRLIVLRFLRSFVGREDTELRSKLDAETSGILLWAVRGWERLREAGRFVQPASGLEKIAQFKEANNPIGAFLAECCETGVDHLVSKSKLYEAWTTWCKANGRDHPGSKQGLSIGISTVLEGLGVEFGEVVPRDGERRVRAWKGLKLRDDLAAY
ncbi:DNA primase family protein [Paludisphaera mucosa]|uniref:Phage/plasmid primase, P4 family n=1 Tax=Paludisphaera mucosa TaxID=3030827 RepID=A0ABT6F6Q7_9BACT|nr:phage/plasmid primase, P4 family [Paludisphaera mucosa]MDG3003270.1 phage/plasmid primase, P4 family [Paludisphaera mucosa]